MTREDAVEFLLKGEFFEPCRECDGQGKMGANRVGDKWTCLTCEGFGVLHTQDTIEACKLLGRPPPHRKFPGLKSQKVVFPTFEVSKQVIDLSVYDGPITKLIDQAKPALIDAIDQAFFDDLEMGVIVDGS